MLNIPKSTTPKEHLQRIQTMYSYVGHPPSAYGSPDSLVIKTVLRSLDYLQGTNYKDPIFDISHIAHPVNGVTDQAFLEDCTTKFISHYKLFLPDLVRKFESKVLTKSYEELASGRQTYCWLSDRNVAAPVALRETIRIFERNIGHSIPNNIFLLMQALFEFLTKDAVELDYLRVNKRILKNEKNKEWMRTMIIHKPNHWIKYSRNYILTKMCTLSTMTKTKERSKEERRAIVSASMLARIPILITEWFSEALCGMCENSAYPQGPQEKKQLVLNLFNSMPAGQESLEITGDNTKWNEALSPRSIMYILKRLYEEYSDTKILSRVFDLVNYIFQEKRARLNQGIPFKDSAGQSFHIPINELKNFNHDFPKSELSHLEDNYDPLENTVAAHGGMFMGMLNGGSTVLAMVAFEYVRCENIQLIQSSDDFVLMTTGKEKWKLLEKFIFGMKRCGINISTSKSIILEPAGISEFNQMVRFGDYTLNCATELPSANLTGRNPIVDLSAGLRTILEGVNKEAYSPYAAGLQIQIFISKYRRQYHTIPDGTEIKAIKRSKYLFDKQESGVDLSKYLLYHGGPIRHSYTTSLFSELEIGLALGNLDLNYLTRLFPKENPLLLTDQTNFAFNIETKKFERIEEEMDRSILSFTFARNRSYLNATMDQKIEKKKGANLVMEEDKARRVVDTICRLSMPDLAITRSSSTARLWDVLKVRMLLAIHTLSDGPEKDDLIERYGTTFGSA